MDYLLRVTIPNIVYKPLATQTIFVNLVLLYGWEALLRCSYEECGRE